jgi:two-component system NtrC family sensor kinase
MIAILSVVIIFGAIQVFIVYNVIGNWLEDQYISNGIRLAHHFAEEIEEPYLYKDQLTVQKALLQWSNATQEHGYAFVVSPDGEIFASSFKMNTPLGLATANLPENNRYRIKTIFDRNTPYIDIAVPIMKGAAGWLRLGLNQTMLKAPVKKVITVLLGFIGIFIVFGILGSVILSKMITYPIHHIARKTENVNLDGSPLELKVETGDEIEQLAHTFEEMTIRLQQNHQRLSEVNKKSFEAEKLASLGLLSSGIAHEINNPLAGIDKGLRRISRNPEDINQTKKYVPLMLDGVDHINHIINGLLTFARVDSRDTTNLDVGKVINQALMLIRHRLERNNVVLNLKNGFGKKLYVKGNLQDLSQVIVNLVINSIDAMPNGGRLSISTVNDDKFVWVEVEDTGLGIPLEMKDKIWEPFYTSKSPGKGTGFVEGKGSSFRFSVPLAQ